MPTVFDFVEDAAPSPTQFDFQPDPEESPSARPIIPAPGEPIPRMAKAPPLSPFEAGQIPTRVAQAQAAGPVPELTGAEIEQMVMAPQVTIPNVIPESWPIARGLFQTAKSIPEFVTAPAAPYILMAQQIPLVREAVDAAMGAGMVKSAAELAGEASVTGDREKMTEAISSGVFGATMLGAPHVAPMIANEIAARRVGPPDLAKVDVEAFPGPANMIRIPDVVEQAQRGGLFRQEALQGAKTVTAPVPRGMRPIVPETPPEVERGLTVIQEIRAKGADTKEKIRSLFPQLSRETAAKLRNQAFPKEKIPDNLSRQDIDRLFLDELNEESNREIQQAFQENAPEPIAQVAATTEPTPSPEPPPTAPEAKAPEPINVGDTIEAKSHQIAGLTHRGKVVSVIGDEIGMVNQDNAPVLVLRKNAKKIEPINLEPTPPAKVEAPAVKEPLQNRFGANPVWLKELAKPENADIAELWRRYQETGDENARWLLSGGQRGLIDNLKDIRQNIKDYPSMSGEKPAAKPVAETPLGKQPWQMTFKEYEASLTPEQQRPHNRAFNRGSHVDLIQQAMYRGETIPDEVLRDYPALTRHMTGKEPPKAKTAAETGKEMGASKLTKGKQTPIDSASKAADQLIELGNKYSSATFPQRAKKAAESAMIRMRAAAAKLGIEVPSSGTWFMPQENMRVAEMVKKRLAEMNQPKPHETPPTGPGISNGPGAAGYGTPGTYSPISELTDRMATSPVKNLHEAIGVGERISDSWARGKDAFSRALGKLRVVPGALKRSWRNVRDLNEVEERVSALDWVLQQSSAKSKIAGETIRKAIPASQVRDAMAIWIDAGEDEAAIRNTLANLPSTTTPRVRRALEAALTLPDDVKTHASNLADYYARRAQEAQAEDVLHGVLEDYFTHVWKKPDNMPASIKAALNTGRVNEYFQYSRQRKIPTLLEGILQGKEPVLDPAEVIPHYNYLMDRAIASRRFIKSLEDAKMPDGKPVLGMWGTRAVVGDPGEGAILIKLRGRPEDYNNYRQIDHPALRKWKWAATDEEGRPVFYEGTLAVHPEAYERLARMMDRSRLTAAKVTRALLRVSGEVKGAKLGLLSPFHQVHLGSHALGHWTNPFFNLRVIDWDAPSTQFAVEKAGLKLAPNPAELANFAEGILSPGLVHKIPVIGPISKAYSEWLFTDYLPRLKLKTFENAWARNRAFYDKAIRAGKITEDQLAMRVGDAINNAYGELNQLWLGKHGRDPRVQRALRLGFLAPDFGEARLRFVGKALKAYSLEERLALGTLFAMLYLSARVGNILTHGDAEFQDWKHAFAVKQGNRWYSMRSVLGDTLHAFSNFPNFLYVRFNPAYARGVMEFFTGRDITGRKRTAGEQVIDELKQVVPIHLGGLTRDDQHVWESFLMAIGVGSQRAAPTVEVSQLARDWRKRRGIESRSETLSDPNSPYRKARIALEFGNRQDFHDAIRELTRQHQARGDRTPRASIRTAFESYYTRPFSGSARLEPAFKASLGMREQRKYQDALIERRRLLQKFLQWY